MRFCASTLIPAATAMLLLTAIPASAEKPADLCFDAKGSVQEVLNACADFIAKGEDKKLMIRAHSIRAMGYSATGNIDEALKDMDAAVKIDPKRANSYFMRAAAYDAKRSYTKAIADLDEAINLNEKDADYYLLRGIIYSHKNELDDALADLNKKVELDPEAMNGYSNRGAIYRKRKEYDLAVVDYSKAIDLDKGGAADPYIDRGWVYVLDDKLDEAGADFDKALKLQKTNALALVGRGLVKSRQGETTDGSADLRLAERLEPGVFDKVHQLGIK